MKDNLIHPKDKPENELIVIADECGDSMWDAVLRQVKANDIKEISTNAFLFALTLMQYKSATQP